MHRLIGAVLILAFAGAVSAQVKDKDKDKDKDKVDLKKLIGKWEPKDTGLVVEFAEKGKLLLTVELMGKSEKVEGTYKVLDGMKLEVLFSYGGKDKKETLTVKKLTDDELITSDSNGKDETLKKKKPKK